MNDQTVEAATNRGSRKIGLGVARVFLAAAVVCTIAPAALAKDLCVTVDSGSFTGSVIVLKKVKLGPQTFGPVHGYFALFNESASIFTFFSPVMGEAMVSSGRNLVVGLSLFAANLVGNGTVATGGASQTIDLACLPGADGKIGVSDSCPDNFVISSGNVEAHIIDCRTGAPPLP